MMRYKKSQFNYGVKTKGGYILYNTLYNSLSRLSEEEYAKYDSFDFSDDQFVNSLTKQGYYIGEGINESNKYLLFSRLSGKYVPSIPCVTITPTMECNARCFYCYENGVRHGQMKIENIDHILSSLKKFDLSNGLNLTWFGGEPLLNQDWMTAFSERLRIEKIKFTSFIITNGSKIDSFVIDKMISKWNTEAIQITVDGILEDYSKRKNYIDQDEIIYYKILKTIGQLARAGIEVSVRLNVDKDNTESILAAAKDISELYNEAENISFYPAFLTGTGRILSEREKISFIKELIEIGNNLRVSEYLYKMPRKEACYYYQENAISIDAKGDIYTCEHQLGCSGKSIGNVKTKIAKDKNTRGVSGQREECKKCAFLPKCHGGCYDSYISGDDPCFIDKYIIMAYLELL